MKDLLKFAIQSTEKNIVKTTSKKSINDALFELLYEQKLKLSKTEAIAHMSLERLEKQKPNLTKDEFLSEPIQKLYKSINVTVKNGFEASVCNGQTNASFSYNKKFKDYDFVKLDEYNESGDNLFTIIKKK